MRNRLKQASRYVLTILAALSFLLLILTVCIIVQSYWYGDHLTIRSGRRWSEWSFACGRFYFRACTLQPKAVGPFDFDKNWGVGISASPSDFVEATRRRSQVLGTNQWRFLGLRSVHGPHTVGNVVWHRYTEGPLWPALGVCAAVPVVWFWRRRAWPVRQKRRSIRHALMASSAVAGTPILLLILLFINFKFLGPRDKPLTGLTGHPAMPLAADANGVLVKLMTYNIHLAGAYRGGWEFESPVRVAELLDDIASFISKQQVDIVFVQEVVIDSGPHSFNQVPRLAKMTGMHMWVFGQCINDGTSLFPQTGNCSITA